MLRMVEVRESVAIFQEFSIKLNTILSEAVTVSLARSRRVPIRAASPR